MYLKKVDKIKAKTLTEVAPFVSGTWYIKMNDNGTVVTNVQGQPVYTCMAPFDLQIALENKEFSRVEY